MGVHSLAAPFNPFERRTELQLAALLVLLVMAPGAADVLRAREAVARPPGAGAPAPAPSRSSRGRHVRPPRSC